MNGIIKYIGLLTFIIGMQVSLDAQNGILVETCFRVDGTSSNIRIEGNVQNENTIQTETDAEIHFLGTNWQNLPNAQNTGSGTVIFKGTTAQTLDGGGNTPAFPKLTVDNANNITLQNTDTKIGTTLTFTNGHLILGTNNMRLGINASATGYDQTKFIVTDGIGELQKENVGTLAFEYPVGASIGSYTPAIVKNNATNDSIGVRVFAGTFENLTSGGNYSPETVGFTWLVEGESNDIDLSLQHNTGSNGAIYNPLLGFISEYMGVTGVGGSSTKWSGDGGNGADASTTGSVAGSSLMTKTGVALGSPHYFTKTSTNHLPIELISFNGQSSDCSVILKWSTATETNNAYFEVERSKNGLDFETIAQLEGAGNSNEIKNYTFVDDNPPIRVFYRLKQVDFDYNYSYSDVIFLKHNCEGKTVVAEVYPNPAENYFNVLIKSDIALLDVSISLTDALGRELNVQTVDILDGQSEISVDTAPLAEGMYFVSIKDPHYKIVKIIKLNVINK